MNEPQTPEQTPEQTPTQTPAPRELDKQVTITVDGNMYTSLRNFNEIKTVFITDENLLKFKDTDTKISINLNFKDSAETPVLLEGTYNEILVKLDTNILTTTAAMKILQHFAIRLIETSTLKCGIITLLFDDDNKVGGIGLINETVKVTDGNIKAFISAAEGQLDMYKNKMREAGITLDEGNIIIPGR